MNVKILTGFPGSGKSRALLHELLSTARRHLVAFPRIDLMQEQAKALVALADELGISLDIRLIHSGDRKNGDVKRQIEAARTELDPSPHAVVMMTHEGLRLTDLSEFPGWSLAFDETPELISAGQLPVLSKQIDMADLFVLSPLVNGMALVSLADNAPSPADTRNNDFLRPVADFLKAVAARQMVLVDTQDWQKSLQSKQKVRWLALWLPFEIDSLAGITVTAANFTNSLCGRVLTAALGDRLTLEEHIIGCSGDRAQPEIRIHYFTQNHKGSTAYWDTSEGRGCLNRIARYFQTIAPIGYWSGNGVVQRYLEHWMTGELVSPKIAGSNAHIHKTSCAMVYSAKTQPSDQMILDFFGWDEAVIREARETEDIAQFVLRGSIRRPEYDGGYDIYLYDRDQAERLNNYFLTSGITSNVTVIPVETAGMMEIQRPDAPRRVPPANVDPSVVRAKARDRKRKSRAKKNVGKEDAGQVKRRGRPRKSVGSSPSQPLEVIRPW